MQSPREIGASSHRMAEGAASAKLKALLGVGVLVVFWRRLRQKRREAEGDTATAPSLLVRSASELRAAFTALPSPSSEGGAGALQPSLSQTWSPRSLTRLLADWRGSSGQPPSPPPARPPRLTSWCEFQEDSLHHPDWGYYSDGRVVFGESSETADFTTFPVSMRPAFGAMLADRACELWKAAGGGSEPFLLLELGAGTGVLAHDVLAHCEACLPHFYAAVRYVIGERSASLREVQAQSNTRFVTAGKLRVVRCARPRCVNTGAVCEHGRRCASTGCARERGSGTRALVGRHRGAALPCKCPPPTFTPPTFTPPMSTPPMFTPFPYPRVRGVAALAQGCLSPWRLALPLMGFHGLPWASMGFHGLPWAAASHPGASRSPSRRAAPTRATFAAAGCERPCEPWRARAAGASTAFAASR